MAHARRRLLHVCGALAAGGALLLAGCSSGGADAATDPGRGTDTGKGTRTSGSAATPAPQRSTRPAALDFTPDPKRAPRNAADAKRLALAVVAGPEAWGPGYVARTPRLSRDGYWPVLGTDCAWDTGTLPHSVLASVTAYSEIPASGGKGPLRVAATVTVHRTVSGAEWEMAETLEEALRCPDQELRQGENISGLISLGNPFGSNENYTADDALGELGSYESSAFKGKQTYAWYQSRIGQVTVATVVKGAPGYGEKGTPVTNAQVQALVTMLERLKGQLKVQP